MKRMILSIMLVLMAIFSPLGAYALFRWSAQTFGETPAMEVVFTLTEGFFIIGCGAGVGVVNTYEKEE